MEVEIKRIPFDLELAKKIMNHEIINGRIVTQEGLEARIIHFDMNKYGNSYLTVLVDDGEKEFGMICLSDGKRADVFDDGDKGCFDLYIELSSFDTYNKGHIYSDTYKWKPYLVRDDDDENWKVMVCAGISYGMLAFYNEEGEIYNRVHSLPLTNITEQLIGTSMSFDELLKEIDSTYRISETLKV